MRLSELLLLLAQFLFPPALIGTIYTYSFPVVQQCGFSPAKPAEAACYLGDEPRPGVAAQPAPFRLLAIADPQLEGDTSLPDYYDDEAGLGADGVWEALRDVWACIANDEEKKSAGVLSSHTREQGEEGQLQVEQASLEEPVETRLQEQEQEPALEQDPMLEESSSQVQYQEQAEASGQEQTQEQDREEKQEPTQGQEIQGKQEHKEFDQELQQEAEEEQQLPQEAHEQSPVQARSEVEELGVCVARTLKIVAQRTWPRRLVRKIQGYHKRLDLWGNDRYLCNIFWLVKWWTDPTHVVVLGDLLGSQWIGDEEFQRRSDRFWKVVFKGTARVPSEIMEQSGRAPERLGNGSTDWRNRIIAVVGNHDIGYAGDLDAHRVRRFEQQFGSVNWETRFRLVNESTSDRHSLSGGSGALTSAMPSFLDTTPELRVMVLNSMNLDGPAFDDELQQDSQVFLDNVLGRSVSKHVGTVLLTHIPLHKSEGTCVDAPFFDYYEDSEGGGIREQNHLSEYVSERILNGLTGGLGPTGEDFTRRAIILNGHDHAGCDVYHHLRESFPVSESTEKSTNPHPLTHNSIPDDEQPDPELPPPPTEPSNPWTSTPLSLLKLIQHISGGQTLPQSNRTRVLAMHNITLQHALPTRQTPTLREITVRSMMGSYAGNAGLLSAWYDAQASPPGWQFEYDHCMFGVQHIWWAVHVLDLIVLGCGAMGLGLSVWEVLAEERGVKEEGEKKAKSQ